MPSRFFLKVCGVLTLSLLCNLNALQAQFSVEGRIIDAVNRQGLPKATIINLLDSTYALSDEDGYFTLQARSGIGIIEINFLGYQSVSIDPKKQLGFLNVEMQVDPSLLEQVVVRSNSGVHRLLTYPGSITVLTPEVFQQEQQITIEPFLNQVPGLYMHSGALNTNRITIRGIGARSLFSTSKIRAYFNNIPLTDGIGETALEDIDLSQIGRVEVIKGPSGSSYGAGLGGTIIFSSSRAPYRFSRFKNHFSAGSFGLLRHIHAFDHSSEDANLTLQYSRIHSDGYRDNNAYDRHSVFATSQFYLKNNGIFSVLANFIDLKAFIPSSLDSTNFATNPEEAAFTWGRTMGFEDYNRHLVGMAYEQELLSILRFSGSMFTSRQRSYEVRPFNILRDRRNSIGGRLVFDLNLEALRAPVEISAGAEYFREFYDFNTFQNIDGVGVLGPVLSDFEEIRSYYNLFFKSNFTIRENLSIVFGLNVNDTRYELTDRFVEDSIELSGNYGFETVFSPRLGLNYKISEGTTMFASVAHGFSPPTLEETLTPDGLINPEIQPETGWSFELGGRGRILKDRVYFDITGFAMIISDLLVARRTAVDQFVGINAGKTRHMGIEADVDIFLVKPAKSESFITSLAFTHNFTLAEYRFIDFLDEDEDFSGNLIPGVPKFVYNAGLNMETRAGWYLHTRLRTVSGMPVSDENLIFSDAFAVLNVKTGYRTEIKKRIGVEIYGGVNNVLDEQYASMLQINAGSFGGNAPRYYYPGLPTNWYAGISLNYRLN